MNALAVLFLALAAFCSAQGATQPATVRDQVVALSKSCAAEANATPEQSKISVTQDLPKDEVERCFLECVYTGVGVVQGGHFSPEGSKKLALLRFTDPAELDTANKLIDICAKEVTQKSDKCYAGQSVRECFVKNGKEVNFFPSS